MKIGPVRDESTQNANKIFVALPNELRLVRGRANLPCRNFFLRRMATYHRLASTPLTFELPRALVDHIQVCRGRLGLKSVSEVVRHALAAFDFAGFRAPPREQLQISVRLSADQKLRLFRGARLKKVSAGELLRAALEAVHPDGRRAPKPAARRHGRNGRNGRKPAAGKKRR